MASQNHFNQAVSAHQAGRLAEAERLYAQVLAVEPRYFPALYQLAFLFYQQRRTPEALGAVAAALASSPGDRDALLLHGVLASAAGQLEAALASFDRVLAAAPASTEALYHRANVLLDLNRFADAVAAYDAALVQTSGLFEAWSNRGLALYELKRFAEALASYDRALEIRPDDARAWSNRGKAQDSLGWFPEALASYDKALALVPEYAEAWYARALTLRTMHRLDDALASVDKALALRDAPPIRFFRAWLLCELNRITEGLALIQRTAEQGLANDPAPSAHKQRHDLEQSSYIAAQGVSAGGDRLASVAVAPGNTEAATQWQRSIPKIAVIDNFLTPEALGALRRFCWGARVWRTSYPDGYLGAMPEQGFACPLLAQIAEELRDRFPAIIGDHRLRMLWGFKYDSRLKSIGIHADQAAVNVNFWITPDEANRNPDSGGLKIWDVAAPRDWDIAKYNGDEAAVRAFLAQSCAKPVAVPYRANRAVIFDSDLFHETDAIDFADGYLNRRINITMLFGRRTHYGA